MKKFLVLMALSCTSTLAADSALQLVSLSRTNGTAVFTMDIFTRNGETNLICSTVTRAGSVESRFHKFYEGGTLVGEYWSYPDSCGFITEANSPYSLIFKSSPSNHVSTAYICSQDRIVIDYFTATNGIFYPVDAAAQEARKMTTETQKAPAPVPQ